MNNIIVGCTCPSCGDFHKVEVNLDHYIAWEDGELIQNAMPELSATEREQLISNLCPKCQNDIFGNFSEEEY